MLQNLHFGFRFCIFAL